MCQRWQLRELLYVWFVRFFRWIKPVPVKPHRTEAAPADDVYSTSWFVRRVFAEFTEAQFYGNEVASAFLLAGAVIGTIVCGNHGAYGSGAVPAIILSQLSERQRECSCMQENLIMVAGMQRMFRLSVSDRHVF